MASSQIDRIGSVQSALAIKAPVRCATTADINSLLTGGTLGAGGGGLPTIDGIALAAGDRVLVKNQADQTKNGIYVASTTAWNRDVDFQDNRAVTQGTIVLAAQGSQAGLWFELTTTPPITIGSTNLTFAVTSNPTVSAAMSPVVGALTLAAAQAAMGLLSMATQSASAVAITGGTISGIAALTNKRIAVSAAATVANVNKGALYALGGSAWYALTFNAANTYDTDYMILVVNEDNGRGKQIVGLPGGTFVLWPGQAILAYSDGSAWHFIQLTGPRFEPATLQFNVDPVNGSDYPSSDGLGTSATAFRTIQGTINTILKFVDEGIAQNITIQLADGTYTEQVNCVGSVVGGHLYNVNGHAGVPTNVAHLVAASQVAWFGRDLIAVQLSNFELGASGSGATGIQATQLSVIDINTGMYFGSLTSGIGAMAQDGGAVNVAGNYTFNGNCTEHLFAQNLSRIDPGSGLTVTMPAALAFTYFVLANWGSHINATTAVTYTGTGSGAGSSGTKYTAQQNSTISLGGTTFPGATAGGVLTGGYAA